MFLHKNSKFTSPAFPKVGLFFIIKFLSLKYYLRTKVEHLILFWMSIGMIFAKKNPIFKENWDFSPKSSENLKYLLRNMFKLP